MKFKLNKTFLAISLLSAGFTHSALADSAIVEIDLSSQRYIGDTSQLQRNKFFNMHNTGGSSSEPEIDQLFIKNELNAGFGRGFWGPMAAAGGNANYPNIEKALTDGPTAVANTKSDPMYKFYSNRSIVTEHPSSVIAEGNDPIEGARWAADYFEHYYDDETRPIFYEPMNEPFVHASDFVDGPWDPVANQAMQEHMANWFKEIGEEFDNRGIETNVIGFSSAWPSFELDDFDNWNTRMKMFMDVAGEQMDAMSFHLYDGVNVTGQDNFRSGSNAEAIIDMIETYSHIKWDEIKPHALTEYGGIVKGYPVEYSPEKSSQELRSYNHLLFSFLERENRILTSIPFITGKAKWFYEANNFQPYSATVFRPDPEAIVAGKVNNFLPTEKAKFYYLWADVKGHRVAINTPDPDLGAQAFAYGNKAYVALNNYEDHSKDVTLDFATQSAQPSSVRIKRLDVPYKEAAQYSDEVVAQAPSSMTLAAHETVVIEYTYAAPLSHDTITRTRSYYADNYLEPIIENSPIQFSFDAVEVQQTNLSFTDALATEFNYDQAVVDSIGNSNTKRYESVLRSYEKQFEKIVSRNPDTWQQTSDYQKLVARSRRSQTTQTALNYHYSIHGYNDSENMATLKMSIARKHDKSKQPLVMVNGHPVSVPNDWKGYDQATRSDFFGTIEIPVPAKFLKATNTVELSFPDNQGHVSSLVLEVDTQEAYQHIAATGIELLETEVSINKDKPYRIDAQVMPMNASNQFVQWASSEPDVATVDNHGVITPISPGISVITATSYDGQFTETVSLEVKDQLTVRNTVAVKTELSEIDPTNTISVDLLYSTDSDREVFFELYSPANQWLGATKATVAAGSGETSLTLNFDDDLPSGKGYRLTAQIRTIGGDWRTAVDTHVIKDIEISSPYEPPTAEEGNLLGANGGFEFGHLNDWKLSWDTSGSLEVNEEAAKEGQYGLKIDTTDGRVGILINEDVLPQGLVKEGKKFKLSFYMKRASGTGWAGGFAQFWNNQGGWKGTSDGPWHGTNATSPTDWILFEKEIDGLDWPETGTSIQINMVSGGQTWYIDDVKLEDITPAPVQDEGNLIGVNAGFELGGLDSWSLAWDSLGSAVVSKDSAKDGEYGLRVNTTDGRVGLTINEDTLPTGLIKLGKKFKLSFYMRRVSGSGWAGGFTQFINNQDGWKATEQGDWHGTTNSPSDWILVEKEIDGLDWPDTGTFLQINMQTPGNEWDIDSFKLEDITPPIGYKIDVNLNVNHVKGGVDSFDRSKFITMHIGTADNEWPDDATEKAFIEDYDVYFGRTNGALPWQLSRLEGTANNGILSDSKMTEYGNQAKTWYQNNTTAHSLENRMANMMYGGQEFMYPHQEKNTCSGSCEGNTWLAGYDEYARFFSEFLSKYFGTGGTTGEAKPTIIEVMNEPFVKSNKLGTTNANITELHKVVADRVHQDHPNVKVGGFTAAFPALERNNGNFELFDNTWKTFIDGAGEEMDFYSIHLYDNHNEADHQYRSGSNVEAILDMIEHYSVLTIGETKPWVISEYGFFAPGDKGKGPYSRERDWWNIRSFSSMLLQFMDKPDQILTSIPFSILKANWAGVNGLSNEGHRYSTRLFILRDELDGSIDVQDNGDWIYSDIKKFYELWSEVKGKRVDTITGDLDLQSDAYVDGNTLYFIVNNLEHNTVEFDFNLIDTNSVAINSISSKHVYWDAQAQAPMLVETNHETDTSSFSIEANATAIIKVVYATDITINQQSVEQKYYADTMKQAISQANQDLSFDVNGVQTSASHGEATLRLGLGRDLAKSLTPTVTVNGTAVDVPEDFRGYDQNTRDFFFGVIEIPVPYNLLRQDNQIKVRFSDIGGFVTSVTLQTFEQSAKLTRFQ